MAVLCKTGTMESIDYMLRDCPDWLTPAQAAAALGKSRQSISKWLNRSVQPLPGLRIGGRWTIRTAELRTWLAEGHN